MTLKYFKLSEFNCPFLQDQKMNYTFLEKLDRARGLAMDGEKKYLLKLLQGIGQKSTTKTL